MSDVADVLPAASTRPHPDARWRAHWGELTSCYPELAELRPCDAAEPNVGSEEDWTRVEQALGFTEFDPVRRHLLSGLAGLCFEQCFSSLGYDEFGDPFPSDIRPSDIKRALN